MPDTNLTPEEQIALAKQWTGVTSPSTPEPSPDVQAATNQSALAKNAISGIAPPARISSTGGTIPGGMENAVNNISNIVSSQAKKLNENTPFPETPQPTYYDQFKEALPYLGGTALTLAALYGGHRLMAGGKKETPVDRTNEPTVGEENPLSFEEDHKRRESELKLAHMEEDLRAKRIKNDLMEKGPNINTTPAGEPEVDLMAEIEKKHPHVAKAIKEGRVSIAGETAAATQQTEPVEIKDEISKETPKDHAPLETTEPNTKAEAGTESGGAASKDQNVPKSKTATPKGAAVPTATQGHPELEPLKGFYEPETGLFKSTEVGSLDQGFKNRFGNEERIKFIKEVNGGKRLGSPSDPTKYNDELNALGDKWVKYKQENNLPVTDKREETLAKRDAFIKENVGKGMLEADAKAAAEAQFPHTSNGMALGKKAKIGGVAGLALTAAELANASPKERANIAGESAIGMMPGAIQALLYSKGATSPQELEFERKNKEASAEALRKRQEAAPRLYTPIAPTGSLPPYWK